MKNISVKKLRKDHPGLFRVTVVDDTDGSVITLVHNKKNTVASLKQRYLDEKAKLQTSQDAVDLKTEIEVEFGG